MRMPNELKKLIIMKLINKIILGALLFTSSAASAQGKSSMNGKKNVTVKTHSTNGITSANEQANANGQIHASDKSILNRPVTTVRIKKNSKYYKSNGNRKYYYKNGKRYTYRSYVRRAA